MLITSHMERFILTTRMTLRRFTRLTNGFSTKTRNHDAMLGLYFAWYKTGAEAYDIEDHASGQGWSRQRTVVFGKIAYRCRSSLKRDR